MSRPERFPDWPTLDAAVPGVAATMRRYLDQLTCLLRPGSVGNADQALRSLAAFLADHAPEVSAVADISRRHMEDFIRWLVARSGRATARLSPATLAHRLGTLRMFFVRIIEWDWPDAPARVPIIPGDLPRQDHPLPKALDDAAAAQLVRAAQTEPRMLVRVVVEVLLRTGLRASSPHWPPTRSCSSAPDIGYTSPSASFTTTGTCRCTRTCSPSSATTAPPTSHPTIRYCCPARTASR